MTLVSVSFPAPILMESAPVLTTVMASLAEPPVIEFAPVEDKIAVTPTLLVPVLVDASSVNTVEPRVPTFSAADPVTMSFVVAAVVRVVITLAVVPIGCSVSVSTPATSKVIAVPVKLLTTIVAESAEPVTSLNVTT